MNLTAMTDEDLMVLYKNGSEAAFSELYTRHRGRVFAFIQKRIRSEAQQKEIFQEVFMKLHRSKSLYDTKFPFLPWLYSVTRNVMIDDIRKSKTYQTHVDELKDELKSDIPSSTGQAPDSEISAAQIDIAEHDLPESQKQALSMRYYDEKSFEEIAEALATSPQNARKLISRGLASLRRSLKGEVK